MKHIAVLTMVALALLTISACGTSDQSTGNSAGTAVSTAQAQRAGDQVIAKAKVVPVRSAALSMTSGGTVAEVLVAEGDRVEADQLLIRLDSAEPQARLTSAQAKLAEVQANYENMKVGATPEEIAAAEAAVAQSQSGYNQTSGSVSQADLAAARMAIQQSREQLARMQAGPKATDLRAAEANLTQSQASLHTQRDQLSANKTSADLQVQQAAQQLVQAQTTYSMAKWNWSEVDRTGRDPINPTVADAANPGKSKGNQLNDVQVQQYKDALTQAEARLRSAEQGVAAAQVASDNARLAEGNGILAAEQTVATAQASLDNVRAGYDADQITGAKAQLARAQATLEQLTGVPRSSSLAAAEAGVAQTQANLQQVLAGPKATELTVARTQIESARAEVQLAQVQLSQTELKAPFAGLVAALDLKANEYIASGTPLVQLADISAWKIESTDLTELAVVNVYASSPVTITFDAIPGLLLAGKVSSVRAFGESKQGDIIYTVTVTPDQPDKRLRWNMTATIAITPAR